MVITKVSENWKGYDSYKPVTIEDAIIKKYGKKYDVDDSKTLSEEEWENITGEDGDEDEPGHNILNLNRCKITDISDLNKLSDKIAVLKLSGNFFTEIPEGAFDKLTNLEDIYLSDLDVKTFPKDVFKNNKKLRKIVAWNSSFTELRKDTFAGLKDLAHIEFIYNEIGKIENGALF